ncbi:hypothetical protein FQN49_007106 [Arthroderma sp. PD_2]|nr:hypothetical protein FQN49_007106 [Arthroderma sp. PD_2]
MRPSYRYFTRSPLILLPSPVLRSRLTPLWAPFAMMSSMSTSGSTCRGESGTKYRLARPLGTQIPGKIPNVWLAIDDSNATEYVARQPPMDSDGDEARSFSAFKHELGMQKLFAKEPMIRPLVDYVPDSEPGGPMIILEAFTDSLWEARNARPFTTQEIKCIMKGVLLGGIYSAYERPDLKMENVAIGGFNPSMPNENTRDIIVRLADCGAISKLSSREITSLTYRSPEVHFGKPWTRSTDVWSWGIILAQLLQAQVDFKSPGMYDSGQIGTLREKSKAVRNTLAIDFDLASIPFYADDEQCAKLLPPPQPDEAYMWANTMVENGVAGEDIQFLATVLNPDPDARLTVREVLESGYLEG